MPERESREKLLARLKERREATRRKWRKRAYRIGIALGAITILLVLLYPFLQVTWKINQAREGDSETRKSALKWLTDNKVKRAIPVFIEALNSTHGESKMAEKALRKFNEPSVVPELLKTWKDTAAKPYARYNALQLLAELGGKELEDVFLDPFAIVSAGWESAYDFLNKHADESTVAKLLAMLESGDEKNERAAAVAFRYLKKKPFVEGSGKVKDMLAARLSSKNINVREESAYALSEIADEEHFDELLAALDDESPAVCRYAAIGIGRMKSEIAAKALPKLLEKLVCLDSNICREAAYTLIKIGSLESVEQLIGIVGDNKIEGFSRQRAIEILKTLPGPRALEAITAALKDENQDVAKTAATALIRIGGEESVAPLVNVLVSGRSQGLKIMAAYVLGMMAQKESAPALIEAMKEGDYELSAMAARTLVKIGAREYAPRLAEIVLDMEAPPVSRRDALRVLSEFRTVGSVEVVIGMLADSIMQVREEARDSAIQLSKDLLTQEPGNIGQVKDIIEKTASEMLQKKIGEDLRGQLEKAEKFEEINSLVFAAMRRLDEKNKPDFDALEVAISDARRAYWAGLMREDFARRGLEPTQLSEAAEMLKIYIADTYLPEEPPMSAHKLIGNELMKRFGFSKE